MLAKINLLRPNLWALAFAAITVIAGVIASSNVSASMAGSDSGAALLAAPNTWLAVGHAGRFALSSSHFWCVDGKDNVPSSRRERSS